MEKKGKERKGKRKEKKKRKVKERGDIKNTDKNIMLPFFSSTALIANEMNQKFDGHYSIFGTMLVVVPL